MPLLSSRTVAGYLFALGAGAVWGTTGPLSTALYAEGQALAGIGFWRVLLGVTGLGLYGVAVLGRGLFRMDRRGLVLVALVGGALVALFEVPYQFGIAGAGVAGAAALLYLAPMMVAVLAEPILGERLTWVRVALALVVLVGAYLTVTGTRHEVFARPPDAPSVLVGVVGSLIAAISYAGTTLMARWAVPRYGTLRVLFWELAGGCVFLLIVLMMSGTSLLPPATTGGWLYTLAMAGGPVLGANVLFFAALKRIEAAPTSVAATIEPVVGAVLALLLFDQRLALVGWLGLGLVVAGVASSYLREAPAQGEAPAPGGGPPEAP
jgi:drug/metabolite transporter (DMT)-like permease